MNAVLGGIALLIVFVFLVYFFSGASTPRSRDSLWVGLPVGFLILWGICALIGLATSIGILVLIWEGIQYLQRH